MKKILLFIVFLFAGNSFAQVLESYSPAGNKYPSNYIEFNGKMHYFIRNYQGFGNTLLYATDGTAANNVLIADLGRDGDLNDDNEFNTHKIIFNNKLFFIVDRKLYSTDGTTAGTSQFITILSSVKYFKIYNNKLYFTAVSSTSGNELWSTDGTVAGTQLVKDINTTAQGSSFIPTYNPHFTIFNNKLFFVANDGVTGFELWSTDGTEAGTSLLKDIRTNEPKTGGSGFGAFSISYYNPYPFKVVGNKMYFGANPWNNPVVEEYIDKDSFILYETDGTAAGTKFVQPPLANPALCGCGNVSINYIKNVSGLTVYDNKLFVNGRIQYDNVAGVTPAGIHVLDGSNPITLLKEMYGDNGDVGTSDETERYSMRLFNGEFYFVGLTGSRDRLNLWKMNPNDYNFTQMTQTPASNLSEFSDDIGDLRLLVATELNNRLHYVKTRYGNGSVFSTDGTVSGSRQEARFKDPKDSNTKTTLTSTVIPNTLFGFNNALYFKSEGNGLFRINFNTLGTTNFESKSLKIYPNPASNQLTIFAGSNLEKATLKIFSILGQTVLEKHNVSGTNVSLDVSGLSNGNYIIQVNDSGLMTTSKFIKH